MSGDVGDYRGETEINVEGWDMETRVKFAILCAKAAVYAAAAGADLKQIAAEAVL